MKNEKCYYKIRCKREWSWRGYWVKIALEGCFPALVTPMGCGDPVNFPINYKAFDDNLQPLFDVLFLSEEGNPQWCHYALRRIGIPVGVPRLPLVDVSAASAKTIDKALYKLDLIWDFHLHALK